MYTKYYTKQKGINLEKDPLNFSILPLKSNRTKSNPNALVRTTPKAKPSSSKQKSHIPRNDFMFNLAMSNIIKFQDAMGTRPTITNCLSMSNIEDKKNEEAYLNDSNDLIQRNYQPEPLPQKLNNILNDSSNDLNQNRNNDRKLLYTLKTLDLENLFFAFNLNSITFNDLFLLSKEDLLELRIPLGPRNRLLHFAEEYKKTAKDYDYQELTEFFERNRCFLINHVQDFSCSNIAEYAKNKESSILLSPKGNSRQPHKNIINHISSLNNVSSINLNSNINSKDDIYSTVNVDQRSKRILINDTNNCYNNFQKVEKENDKDSDNTNLSLLKGLSCTNVQQNHSNSSLVKKKNNYNSFLNQQHNNNNSNKERKDSKRLIKDKDNKQDKIIKINVNDNQYASKYVAPMPSLNESITSLTNTNNTNTNTNYNNNNLQIVPLTIANIEEPIQIQRSVSELFENSPNESESMSYYDTKYNNINKSDLIINSTPKQIISQKTKNKTQLIQNFQNIFIEVEQFQHQYESMKEKNDQRKTKMNTLVLKMKDNEISNRVNHTQPRNRQISIGKEDLYNESERNLNDELNKLYDSEIKTSSNTSIQHQRYYGTNSNKDNNSRYFHETDFYTQK